MDDKQLEERLDLLKASYNRLPSTTDVESIVKVIEKGDTPPSNKSPQKVPKRKRLSVWMVSIASVLLIGFFGRMYFLQHEVQQGENVGDEQAVEQFRNTLKEQYPVEREKRRMLLNLSEEEFAKIDFIDMADSRYEAYFDPRNNYRVGKDMLDAWTSELLNELKLPSEMIEEVRSKDRLDKTETIEFFQVYYPKINSIKRYANEKLKEYTDELSIYKVNGLYDLNRMLENEEDLPKELQELMDALQKQGLELEAISNGLAIEFRFNQDDIQVKIRDELDQISEGYFALMAFEPFTYAWELIYPMEETASALMRMETVLLDDYVNTSYSGHPQMGNYYTNVFYFLVKGTRENPIFDSNGTVKEAYREMWRYMAQGQDITPFPYLLIPIIQQFEESGWTKSEAWDDLSYGDIEDALHLAQNGDLEQFMPKR